MGTTLARTSLTKPARGDLNWDDEIQAWLDKLDTYGAFGDLALTWTATQTFAAADAVTLTTDTLAVGSTALAANTFLQAETAAEANTTDEAAAVGDAITLKGQAGQNSTHVSGQGGAGGAVTILGGNGGTGDYLGGDGGAVRVAGGEAAVGGLNGIVRVNGSNIYTSGLLQLTDPSDLANPGPQSVSLTADGTTILPTSSVILITSNSATASQRTFTISESGASEAGRILVLVWDSVNAGEMVASGTVALSATWPAGTNNSQDTLTLIATGTRWVELCRSANATS